MKSFAACQFHPSAALGKLPVCVERMGMEWFF
jgi:hypothetical protein